MPFMHERRMCLAFLDRLGRWVLRVFRDQLVRMEFQEQKAHRARLARRVPQARKV
jgi:hypothetical protein